MSEGADSITQTCENLCTTLNAEDNPEELPPRTISHTTRRPRFGTNNVPLSPYILIDGKKLRSALAFRKKWPPRRVSFPTNDNHLVTGYLEPANPLKLAENINRDDVISAYKDSCTRHNTTPLQTVLGQLEGLDVSETRSEELDLKGETLDQTHSEPLEEILKRVQFNKVNLEGTSLDDESSVILFDMLEYYESAKQLNISSNQDIGIRGWQACAHMIKKTQCLEQLEAKDITLNEQYMNILSRALRLVCHLHVLKLENCGLSGRAIVVLVTALKVNTGIRELYLADNGLDLYDAIQLGSLLRINNHLQLLDISNNNIQDNGVHDILEGLINQVNEDKDGKGLSILVLWNNKLTHKSSPYFSRIIALSKTLETLNIGKNMLTDQLLITVKDALQKNRILLQLGMQSTELTCEGIVTLSEIIQTNQSLRRIDLRDNSIQMTGMNALSSAMSKNKNITQIDLDDKPREKIDGTLHQYVELLDEIRSYCSKNEKSRSSEENSEGSESLKNYSRFCSASSRKISLTCQTLPCSSLSTAPIQRDEPGRSMLEPKRASGGRLRSPAPSPIPSPVASPIPSPSRSRFVVSRVSEASLRSTDSSASSSPVTPPSFGSSPTSFFPSASGSSRFRVSVVESASTVPSPKSVVASSKANVTIGFNYKIDTVESTDSDDSDNVFGTELGASNDQNNEKPHNTSSDTSDLVSNVEVKEISSVTSKNETADVRDISRNPRTGVDTRKDSHQDIINSTIPENKEYCDVRDNQTNEPVFLESVTTRECNENVETYYNESTKAIQMCVNINKDSTDSSSITITDKTINNINERDVTREPASTFLNETLQTEVQTKQNTSVQKHSSNLEKLLALFQHPGSFFSESPGGNQLESKHSFQDSVSSVMALGDKFHHYLKEGRSKVNQNNEVSSWSSDESSLPSKSKSIKLSHIPQFSSLQGLTNMFSSFKLDSGNVNTFEHTAKTYPKPAEDVHNTLEKINEKDIISTQEIDSTDISDDESIKSDGEETGVSSVSKQSLPEDVQSRTNDGHANKDLVLEECRVVSSATIDACSNIVNNSSLPESKRILPASTFKEISEYSVLSITDNNVKDETGEMLVEKVDSVLVERTCDSTLTDSINPTSDSNTTSCNITCDMKVISNVNTIDTLESTHNPLRFHLKTKDDGDDTSILNKSDTPVSVSSSAFIKNSDFNVNNISLTYEKSLDLSIRTTDILTNEVTSICSIDNNNDHEGFANLHNTPEKVESTDTCHAKNDVYWKSTTVYSMSASQIQDISCPPDDNIDYIAGDADLCTTTISKGDTINVPCTNESLEKLPIDNDTKSNSRNGVHRIILNKMNAENPFVKRSIKDNSTQITADSTVVPTVVLSHHKAKEDVKTEKVCPAELEKCDTEDLIFCMTDISTDLASVEKESSTERISNTWPSDTTKLSNPYFALSEASNSHANLLIEKPDNIHRNSQDSGIGEANLPAIDDNIPESVHSHPKESFQESVDSGIESECSSVCVKTDSCIESSKEMSSVKQSLRDTMAYDASEDIHDSYDFDSNIVQQLNTANSDSTVDVTNSYFNTIKCAVVSTSCSITGKDIADTTAIGITADENTTISAESSTAIRAASNASETEDEEDEEDEEEVENDNILDFEEEDEIDEFEEMRQSLEPRYQRYVKWRI